MGVTLAFFHEDGKYPCERERLKMAAYGCAKMCEPSFYRQGLIDLGRRLTNIKMKKNVKNILSRDSD